MLPKWIAFLFVFLLLGISPAPAILAGSEFDLLADSPSNRLDTEGYGGKFGDIGGGISLNNEWGWIHETTGLAVPEPSSILLLLLLGSGGIVFCRRGLGRRGWSYRDSAAYGHFGRPQFPWE